MDIGQWMALIKEKLVNWVLAFVKLLPNLVLAILVLLIFFFVARFLRRFFGRVFIRLSHKRTISDLFSTIIYILILLAGVFISLELMHLEKTVATLLAGAGIIGLALGFAFQDLTANFISGVFIIFRKPFDAGHVVETNGFTGTIEVVNLRSTIIRTTAGLQVTIPNKDIFQKPVINYTLSDRRRIELAFSVSAIPDTASIVDLIRNAFTGLPAAKELQPEIYFTDFTGDTIKVEVWYWVNGSVPEDFLKTRHTIIQQLAKALAPLFQKG